MVSTYSLDKFLNKTNKRLFIFALSGGGKSSFAKKIKLDNVQVEDYGDFLRKHFDLKMKKPHAYTELRRRYEKELLNRSEQLIIPNLNIFLRNENNFQYNLYNESAVFLHAPIWKSNVRGFAKALGNAVKGRRIRYLKRELFYPSKANKILYPKYIRLESKFAENNIKNIKRFENKYQTLSYINNYKKPESVKTRY